MNDINEKDQESSGSVKGARTRHSKNTLCLERAWRSEEQNVQQ